MATVAAVEVSTAYRVMHIPFVFPENSLEPPEMDQGKLTVVEYSGPSPEDEHFKAFVNTRWVELGSKGYMLISRRITPISFEVADSRTELEKRANAAGIPTKIRSGLDAMSSVADVLKELEKSLVEKQEILNNNDWVMVMACINDTWSHWCIDYQKDQEHPSATVVLLRDNPPPWSTVSETVPEDSRTAESSSSLPA